MDQSQWSLIEFISGKEKETKAKETKEKVEKVIKEKATMDEEEDTEKVKVA